MFFLLGLFVFWAALMPAPTSLGWPILAGISAVLFVLESFGGLVYLWTMLVFDGIYFGYGVKMEPLMNLGRSGRNQIVLSKGT